MINFDVHRYFIGSFIIPSSMVGMDILSLALYLLFDSKSANMTCGSELISLLSLMHELI
jgi:hypothetical protein